MYQQAVSQANIVGLCVVPARTACRMRCWICFANIRPGLRSVAGAGATNRPRQNTARINRGHDFACYQRTTQLARGVG